MSLSQILLVPGIGQPPLQELQSLLFAGGQRGGMWLFSELSSLFQDTAGSTPVTTSGQTIGRISDLSGNGNHATQATAGSRPAYDVSGSLRRGSFDGTDDSLATSAIDFSNSDKLTVFLLARGTSSTAAIVVELSATVSANAGSFYVVTGNDAGTDGWHSMSRGSEVASVTQVARFTQTWPDTAMITATHDIVGDRSEIRRNGTSRNTAVGDKGAGNFGNFPLYIGRRGGTSLPFNGLIYGLIVVGGAIPSTATIQRVEAILQAINVGA